MNSFLRIISIAVIIVAAQASTAQLSSSGSDYWFSFTTNFPSPFATDTVHPSIYMVADTPTTVKVEYPGGVKNILLPEGIVIKVVLPPSVIAGAHRTIEKKAIHVYSYGADTGKSFTLWGVSRKLTSSDGFLAVATDLARQAYTTSTYPSFDTVTFSSCYSIVALMDSTKVIITNPKLPNVPELPIDTMNKGDVYTVYGLKDNPKEKDVSGRIIVATNPINVFNAHECALVPTSVSNCDYLVESALPMDFWYKMYHVLPLAGRSQYVLRVLFGEDVNFFSINGKQYGPQLFVRGSYFDTLMSVPAIVCSDNQLGVMQFALGNGDDAALGDPFMMTILPDIHGSAGFIATTPDLPSEAPYKENYLNILAPVSQKGNILLDNKALDSTLFKLSFPNGDVLCVDTTVRPRLIGAQVKVKPGLHSVTYKTPLPATSTELRTLFGYSYGWTDRDAYGYPANLGTVKVKPVISKDQKLTVTCPAEKTIDFGIRPLHQMADSTICLLSSGSDTLTIDSVRKVNDNDNVFTIFYKPSDGARRAPSKKDSVVVRYTPVTSNKLSTAKIIISSNSPQGKDTVFLQGRGEEQVGVRDDEIITRLQLGQNYPNPFNQLSVISCQLSVGVARFTVQDMLGRIVYQSTIGSDRREISFSASSLSGGVYRYSLAEGNETLSRLMVVVK